ncbi:MAG: patatin-like phospholipase family protein [bacterium]
MNKETVGVVLSAGGMRGIAIHTGALKAILERYEIGAISGTSAGAIISGIYASGVDIQKLEDMVSNLKVIDYYDPDLFGLLKSCAFNFQGWTGFLKGKALEKTLQKALVAKTFEECKIPLYIVATSLRKAKTVFKKGAGVSLVDAMIASASIPIIFKCRKIGDEQYVDGAISSGVPIMELIENEPHLQTIICINLEYLTLITRDITNPYGILIQCIDIASYEKHRVSEMFQGLLEKRIIDIKPKIFDLKATLIDPRKNTQIIKESYQKVKEALPEYLP